MKQPRLLEPDTLLPLDIFQLPAHSSSGLRYFPATTLQNWNLQIKNVTTLDETDLDEENLQFDANFNLDDEESVLRPILNFDTSTPDLPNQRSQLGDNPTSTTITLLVNEHLPLNEKQRLVVERVLSGALS
jgi:hypothetical protein